MPYDDMMASTQGPVDMRSYLERMFSNPFKRGPRDIELPSEGIVDPRLAGLASPLDQMTKAAQGYKALQKNEILRGLTDAGPK
jgi:hypothetical protein